MGKIPMKQNTILFKQGEKTMAMHASLQPTEKSTFTSNSSSKEGEFNKL